MKILKQVFEMLWRWSKDWINSKSWFEIAVLIVAWIMAGLSINALLFMVGASEPLMSIFFYISTIIAFGITILAIWKILQVLKGKK